MSILDVEQRGDVAVLHWDDGENRYHPDSLDRWEAVLGDLETREGPLAVVVTGAGKFFSNGLDLDWMSAHPERSGEVVHRVHQLLGRLLTLPAYTVGALNGHAFAGGAMLACCVDVRVMRDDRGYWCLPEVDLGLPLTPAMEAVISVRLPRTAAYDAIITGRRYTATEAHAMGIVDHVAAEDRVVDLAVELATPMAAKDRSVIATHKRMLFGGVAERCGWTPLG